MEARQPFSRLGWALFAQMAVMLAAQWGVLLWPGRHGPACWESRCFCGRRPSWGPTGWGFPAACLVLRGRRPSPAPARRPLGPVRFAALLAGSVGLAYLANGATLLLTGLLGRLRGAAVVNPVESIGLYPFRSSSCWRAHRPCGGGASVPQAAAAPPAALWGSALRWWPPLCFGLFHGNLNQFFMPFFWGWCWRS